MSDWEIKIIKTDDSIQMIWDKNFNVYEFIGFMSVELEKLKSELCNKIE